MVKPGAELLVQNARVWSGTPRPADTVAVHQGRILAVGRAAELAPLRTSGTRVVDAAGATVTPGLADAHIHLLSWSRAWFELDLSGCASRAEALARVARHLAAHPGDQLVVGRGWQSHAWTEPPECRALDAVTGARPVLLHAKDFHTLWANSAALAASGIDGMRPDPAGGRIERDAAGRPTGLLRENAARLCEELERSAPVAASNPLDAAIERLHAAGITMVHDFEGREAARALRAVATADPASPGARPRLRVLMHLPHAMLDHALALGLSSGIGDDAFRLGAIKLFADGTLGSRTAALLAPYEGTDDLGLELLTPGELQENVRRAFAGGLSVAVHAIGDRACRAALDAFESGLALLPGVALPPRIEHVQLLDDHDLPRFARLGVAASMQPAHCTADVELAERGWGARVRRSYPWRGLLEGGALLAFGSDAPVEPPDVAFGLWAATTRLRRGGGPAFVPEQRLELDQALSAYTRGPAVLAGAWPRLGSLEPGAWADLVVWNADLHRLPPAELEHARPALTVLGGEVVYESRPGVLPEAAPHARVEGSVTA